MWHYLLHRAPHLFYRNSSVNILKNIIEGCSLSQRQSGQICCPSVSEADGCAVGRLSKYDHPPEGIWLTFSLPQTLVWDFVTSQQASQNPWLLLLQQQRSRASPAERLLKPTGICLCGCFLLVLRGIMINLSMNNNHMCIWLICAYKEAS